MFSGNNPLTGQLIWDHKVNGGSEAIKDKLKSLYNWDGSSSEATFAAKLDADGIIAEWQLHIFGKTKGSSPFLSSSLRISLCLSCRLSQLAWVWAWGQSPS